MRLFMIDCWLETARINLRNDIKCSRTLAKVDLEKAHALISKTGYNRRTPELAALDAHLAQS